MDVPAPLRGRPAAGRPTRVRLSRVARHPTLISPPVATEPPPTDAPDTGPAPEPCMACRGTGQVLSHLGGPATKVTCPWCRGGGRRLTDVDAQEAWLDGSGDGPGTSRPAAEAQAATADAPPGETCNPPGDARDPPGDTPDPPGGEAA